MVLTEDQNSSITKIEKTFAHFNDTIAKTGDAHFDTDIMRGARIVDATSAGTAVSEIHIGKAYSNRRDQFTTAAFIPLTPIKDLQKEASPPGGVTRSINLTYLRPLPLPATVRVEAEVVQFGGSMSLVRGNITSKDGKKVYFTGEQHKVNAPGSSQAPTTTEAGKSKL